MIKSLSSEQEPEDDESANKFNFKTNHTYEAKMLSEMTA